MTNLDWSGECLGTLRDSLKVIDATTIEFTLKPSVSHIAERMVRLCSRGELEAELADASRLTHSTLPGIEDLDEQQRAAVEAPPRADLMINAGAGSGKTHTLAFRIAHLITRGAAPPNRCLVLTYSNAAKLQIKERLNGLASAGYPALADVEVRTIHSLAHQIVATAARLGRSRLKPGFRVVEQARLQIGKTIVAAPAPFIEQHDELFKDIDDGLDLRAQLTLYPAAIDSLRNGHPDYGVLVSASDLTPGPRRAMNIVRRE